MPNLKSSLGVPYITGRAFTSILSPKSWPIIIGAIVVSAMVIGLLWLGASWLIGWSLHSWISWDWLITFLEGAAALGLVWAVFPILIPLFISFFVNQLAAKIERQEYTTHPQGKDMLLWPEFKMDGTFALYALGLNVLILPIYLIPGINLIIYYLLNAHLLGKQYYMMIARRHMAQPDLKGDMRSQRRRIYMYGLIIVLTSTIPVVNLLAPAFATALMVHVFQYKKANQPAV